MAMTQRSRSVLYQGLTGVIADPQAVEEMLAYFPSRDIEEPVTKEFLRAELGEVRAEMAGLRIDMAELRTELRTELGEKLNRLLIQLIATMTAFITLVLVISRIG